MVPSCLVTPHRPGLGGRHWEPALWGGVLLGATRAGGYGDTSRPTMIAAVKREPTTGIQATKVNSREHHRRPIKAEAPSPEVAVDRRRSRSGPRTGEPSRWPRRPDSRLRPWRPKGAQIRGAGGGDRPQTRRKTSLRPSQADEPASIQRGRCHDLKRLPTSRHRGLRFVPSDTGTPQGSGVSRSGRTSTNIYLTELDRLVMGEVARHRP
jgi:hypothetical protein